jgi:hypothetical protein
VLIATGNGKRESMSATCGDGHIERGFSLIQKFFACGVALFAQLSRTGAELWGYANKI